MVGQLGLEVRCGIHTGEVERRGKDLEGIAVHIGSRIADEAEPGEILVSNAVREMETGTGFRCEDRGKHSLKGVPGEWRLYALEGLPSGPASFRTGRWVPEVTARHAKIAGMVMVGLVIVAGIVAALRTVRSGLEPRPVMAEGAAPGIAVLPFEVSGADLAEWREGMVTLLSTGLDGAGDLRAIDSRTVLAQWDRRIPGGSRADRDMALQVARSTGARYAVLGSAVSIGENVRLLAEVYRVEDGAHLSSAQVEGTPDSVFALVDGLARETLGVLLEQGEAELPQVNLAALTTTSIPALKDFLEGETLFRRGEIEAAIAKYQAAVDADSTFALAWNRLASAFGWLEGVSDRVVELREHAMRYSHRLPERERLLVEAEYLFNIDSVEGVDPIREATQKYPDDAGAWYLLGEFYYHLPNTLASLEEAEEAFLEAVELEPSFAPYRFHSIELAFEITPDSALAAERVRELKALNPNTPRARAGELALRLAFGEADQRSALFDSIGLLDAELVQDAVGSLTHPRFWDLQESLLRILAEKGIFWPNLLFWGTVFKRGEVAEALRYLDMPGGPRGFPTCAVWEAYAFGIPFPDDVLEAHLTFQASDSTAGPRTACGGFYALDQGRVEDYRRSEAIHRRAAAEALAEGDSVSARIDTAVVQGLEGYALWKEGDPAGALPLLEDAARKFGAPESWRLWIGQIHLELGRPEDAVPYFRSIRFNPLADYYEGMALERAGEFERALESYESLLEHWRDADPELQPIVEEARQGAIRLRGIRRE